MPPSDRFRRRLQSGAIVVDGSMALELAAKGLSEFPPDIYNLKNPVAVEQIHREFMDAGAELLQTNTSFANRLALDKFGLSDKVYEINRKGVWIARCVALHKAYVAGVVGPTTLQFTPIGKLTETEAFQVFVEQIIALLDGGADALMFKSFISADELEIAIKAAKFVSDSIPIIACKTFPEDGAVLSTSFPLEVLNRIAALGVDVVGANGSVGPQRMFDIVKAAASISLPLCALPETAIPVLLDEVPFYNAEPEYVAEVVKKIIEQGAIMVGAEGGASIRHVKAIADIARLTSPGSNSVAPNTPKILNVENKYSTPPSRFAEKLDKKEFVSTVEIEIPRGLDMSSVLSAAKQLHDYGVDAVNIFDGARARVRVNPIALSHRIQSEIGIDCITHLACRDRNMVGLQSDLLGADLLSVQNLLAVTGDPASIGDHPTATSVYDLDSIGLIRAAARLNNGKDLNGNPLGQCSNFLIACACNPTADNIDREIQRLEKKFEEGATVAFSQPLFEMEVLENFLEKTSHLPLRFILGIIPLRSRRHANFLHYEVPGMVVPKWVRKQMEEAGDSIEAATAVGMEVAANFLRQARPHIQGVYIMPPAKRYSMAIELIQQTL